MKHQARQGEGSGVICEAPALPGAVIPAEAGIYSVRHWKCAADGLDSRLRGNDQCFGKGSDFKRHHYQGEAVLPSAAKCTAFKVGRRKTRCRTQCSSSLALIALLAAISMVSSSCKKSAPPEIKPVVEVQVAVAEKATIQHNVIGDAVLYPLRQAAMVPKISAPVKTYYVNRGSHVRAGGLLAVLENQDLLAAATDAKGAYEQAQAAYVTATKATLPEAAKKAELDVNTAKETVDGLQKVYESRQTLYKQGAIPRRLVDEAATAYTQARNQYELARQHLQSMRAVGNTQDLKAAQGQLTSAKGKFLGAQAQLSYSEIRSPIDGVVTDRPLNPGEMAAAGSPILTVMDLSQVIARAHISQQDATSLRVGNSATISAPGIAGQIPGKVTVVSPALDPTSTTVEVWVQAGNPGEKLKPGTSVRVTIIAETIKDAIVIPSAALLTAPDGTKSVMIVNGDKPASKSVKPGARDGENVQIIEGLAGGQRVVTVGAFELSQEAPDVLAKTTIQIQVPAPKSAP